MAKTIFELTEGSAPLLTDYALTGEDPANTHVLRRTTWQTILNLFKANMSAYLNADRVTSTTATGTVTLGNTSTDIQLINANGASRFVYLPVAATTNHAFIIGNTTAVGYNLIVKKNDGTEIATIKDGGIETFLSSGTDWIWLRPINDGWIQVNDTWTYATATTFTISGDKTGVLSIGDKIKLTQTTVKYFYVVGVSYSSPNTTVTVTGGSTYSLANAAITSPYYSHSDNPVAFPHWFNYTPTGISATNVTLSGRFCINGRMVRASFRAVFSGAITFTSMPTLPVTASANYLTTGNSIISACGVGGYLDNGTAYFPGELTPTVMENGTTLGIYKVANGTGQPSGTPISATVPITWANGDAIECQYTYEI